MVLSRKRHQYEALSDHEHEQLTHQPRVQHYMLRTTWCIATLVATVAVASLSWQSSSSLDFFEHQKTSGKHTIPTFVSVVHEEKEEYLMALDNPLYERLKQASFTHDFNSKNVVKLPSLHVDRFKIGVREPLTLSWSLGEDESGASVLKDEDVIALYCGDQIWEYLNRKSFLDAATIAQARATHEKHKEQSQQADNQYEQQWHFSSFPVIRHELCQFSLYQALTDSRDGKPLYALLGDSPIFEIEFSRTVPTNIHLALGNDPSEMVVQFVTGEDKEAKPVAQYNKEGDKNVRKVSGTTHTYSASDLCEAPANVTEAGKFQAPGFIHVIRFTDLEPNAVYEYKVGLAHGQGITWSNSYSFTAAPPVGDTSPFTYLVYGDQGCPSTGWGDGGVWTSSMTSREVLNPPDKAKQIRAVHHFGDLSYARGAAHIWDEWFNMISPFTTKVPLMIAVGNHEYDHLSGGGNGKDPSGVLVDDGYRPLWGNFANDSGGECGVPTANHFTMPNSTNSNGVFWYSYDFGMVHTTVFSSEHDLSPGSPQYEWMEADFRAVDRIKTPWLILEGHRPFYESQMIWVENAVGIARRLQLEDLLKDYKVDLVLAGHYHSYLRSCDGLHHSRCNNGGPMHITVGSAGAILSLAEPYSNSWTDNLILGEYGYGRITVANASALLFEFVKAGDSNDTTAGEVHDQAWILRER